jgi:hypothetical protein
MRHLRNCRNVCGLVVRIEPGSPENNTYLYLVARLRKVRLQRVSLTACRRVGEAVFQPEHRWL